MVGCLIISGPEIDYYPNASKTYLVVKDGLEEQAKSIFANTNMFITSSGKHHLGAQLQLELEPLQKIMCRRKSKNG